MKTENFSNKERNSVLPCINISFSSREELTKHIQLNMPFAVKPTKKAKTIYINPFTSMNARMVCVDSVVESLLK